MFTPKPVGNVPPHCPSPSCIHCECPKSPRWYQKSGSYSTKAFGRVPRFRCRACGKYFSRQTFSIDYYAKKKVSYRHVYCRINAGAGIRNIARDLGIRDSTVSNRINRLARNALIVNQMIAGSLPFKEDLVIDGLQNFCVSQYFPDNYTVAVGRSSQFAYGCDYAVLRRCGRMSADQKRKRAALEEVFRADPKAVKRSFRRLLSGMERRLESREIPLILYTDEKKDYQRALWNKKDGFAERMFRGLCRHHVTSSKEGRNQANPLFAANYFDREIRKDMAGCARETVQFPRNACDAMLRMNLYMFDHNVRKPYRINDRELRKFKHAETAGMGRERLKAFTAGFFERRVFPPRGVDLSESARMTLERRWKTPLKERPERLWKYLRA